jgi:hypothetical protein
MTSSLLARGTLDEKTKSNEEQAPHGFGLSSQSLVRMRSASPSGSSNCFVFNAQKNATSPTPPNSSETGIRMARISIYFNRMAFRDTVIDDRDIASAAAIGVAAPTSAKGTATTL